MQRIDAVFAEGLRVFLAHDFSLQDIVEYIHSASAHGEHTLVTSITGHMSELLAAPTPDVIEVHDGQEVISFGALMLTCLRRSFFDEEHAHRYGTGAYLGQPIEARLGLVRGLTETFRLAHEGDEAQQALALSVPPSSHAH